MWTYEFFSTIDLLHFVFRSPYSRSAQSSKNKKETTMVELLNFPLPKQKVNSLTKPYYCID